MPASGAWPSGWGRRLGVEEASIEQAGVTEDAMQNGRILRRVLLLSVALCLHQMQSLDGWWAARAAASPVRLSDCDRPSLRVEDQILRVAEVYIRSDGPTFSRARLLAAEGDTAIVRLILSTPGEDGFLFLRRGSTGWVVAAPPTSGGGIALRSGVPTGVSESLLDCAGFGASGSAPAPDPSGASSVEAS